MSYIDKGPEKTASENFVRQDRELDKYVGVRIRERRKQLKLSQAEVAKKLDITYQQLQKYESGANRISIGRLYFMAQILEVDLEYFIRGSQYFEEKGHTQLDDLRHALAIIPNKRLRNAIIGIIETTMTVQEL